MTCSMSKRMSRLQSKQFAGVFERRTSHKAPNGAMEHVGHVAKDATLSSQVAPSAVSASAMPSDVSPPRGRRLTHATGSNGLGQSSHVNHTEGSSNSVAPGRVNGVDPASLEKISDRDLTAAVHQMVNGINHPGESAKVNGVEAHSPEKETAAAPREVNGISSSGPLASERNGTAAASGEHKVGSDQKLTNGVGTSHGDAASNGTTNDFFSAEETTTTNTSQQSQAEIELGGGNNGLNTPGGGTDKSGLAASLDDVVVGRSTKQAQYPAPDVLQHQHAHPTAAAGVDTMAKAEELPMSMANA